MKFCGNCGKELADDEIFCPECGAQNEVNEAVSNENTASDGTYVTQEQQTVYQDGDTSNDVAEIKKKKQRTVIVAIVAVIVVILAVFGIASCNSTNHSPKNLVKQMEKVFNCKGVDVNDVIKICDPIVAKEMKENIKDDKDLKNDFKDTMKESREELEDEYGSNAKVKLKIKSEKKIKKDDSDFEDMKEYYEDEGYKLQEAKTVKVEMSVKGKDGNDEDTTTLTLVKVNGKWYIYGGGLFSSMF